jgi:hypothetical protein
MTKPQVVWSSPCRDTLRSWEELGSAVWQHPNGDAVHVRICNPDVKFYAQFQAIFFRHSCYPSLMWLMTVSAAGCSSGLQWLWWASSDISRINGRHRHIQVFMTSGPRRPEEEKRVSSADIGIGGE